MYAYCHDMPGVAEETAAAVEREVGDEMPAGLIAHVAGPMTGGWRIIDVWETREAAQLFQDTRLGPAVGRAMSAGAAGAQSPVPFETSEVIGVHERAVGRVTA